MPEARVQDLFGADHPERPGPRRGDGVPRLPIVSGGTDNHLLLVDLRSNLPELTAKKAQETLDLANITCNKNTVPFETRSPFQASGIRLGTPAVTTRGFLEADMEQVADMIHTVLRSIGKPEEADAVAAVKARAVALTSRFPLPYRM
jgi:glycine hydroxymethyltransferase